MKKAIEVPHFAQYIDVTDPIWQERSCGIVSLVMVMDYYGKTVDVHELINKGIEIGGYDPKFGWRHDGIVELAKYYGFDSYRTENESVENLLQSLNNDEPVIVSIHKHFDPKEGGHLAVLTGFFSDDRAGEVISFYLNDPIGAPYKHKNQGIPFDVFMQGWKKRAIYVRKVTGSK